MQQQVAAICRSHIKRALSAQNQVLSQDRQRAPQGPFKIRFLSNSSQSGSSHPILYTPPYQQLLSPSVPQLHLSKGDYVLSTTMHRPESSLDCWGPLKDSQQSYAFSLELAASSPNAIPSFLLGSGSKDHCLQEALPNLPPHSSRSNHLYYSLTFQQYYGLRVWFSLCHSPLVDMLLQLQSL